MSARILFVDDDPAIRKVLPAVLKLHGYEVTTAGTIREALNTLAAATFDVLICDLNIQGTADGFTVVETMHKAQPDCINLILTADPALETAQRAVSDDVRAYIAKPAEAAALILAIEERLEERRQAANAATARPN